MNQLEQSMKEFRDNLQRLNISTRNLVEDGDKKQKLIDVSIASCLLVHYDCLLLTKTDDFKMKTFLKDKLC